MKTERLEKIGIYGGTFNPPHIGHVKLAEEVKKQLDLDKIVVVSAKNPPHKVMPEGSPSAEERLEMTKLAFDGLDFVEVSDIEIRREGPSYTADTMLEFHDIYPDAALWLLMGADMFMTIHMWRRPEEIFSLCRLCVLAREEGEQDMLQKQAGFLLERYGAGCDIVKNPVIEISSTQLREGIAHGAESIYLPPKVLKYVQKKGFYRGV